ncbi:MAG TPA: (5-formylfuran-3-yl)methyl phosphate synthase, partial [Methyloceanibacter sp.]
DIIDFKEPSAGALGAVDLDTLAKGIRFVAGRAPTSATIGDLPMDFEFLREAILSVGSSGVDYVKLGVFPHSSAGAALTALGPEACKHRLIFVLFADAMPEFDAVTLAATLGAHGIMLDTMCKSSGSLLDHIGIEQIASVVSAAKAKGLLIGLAGSLKPRHVTELLRLKPDLLGFRGALCRDGARDVSLDRQACASIRSLMPSANGPSAEMPRLLSASLC